MFKFERYKELCTERNVSSYAVSKATGISNACLSDWKKGKSEPKADKLYKIAKFFGVPMEFFIDEGKE